MKYLSLVFRSFFHGPGVAGAPTCKYHPSCSQYTSDALHKYGPVRGLLHFPKRSCHHANQHIADPISNPHFGPVHSHEQPDSTD